ncbi:MAG: Modification methylase RsrI [Verrucomicrobia subdivision 3 bacterium]|nr:Modification methylase RsrI [Limisphaerales bacterium]MCS1415289.1 Modification methylase RsrI [Limisphaerales bacterium]
MNSTFDLFSTKEKIASAYSPDKKAVIVEGDCLSTLKDIPSNTFKLIITSPPYNIGKVYEKSVKLEKYLTSIEPVLDELARVLSRSGSLCWQVGNYVEKGEVFPLDVFYYKMFKERGMKMRNRVIWHFNHGLHASNRFSGRYETLLWFTKSNHYTFNLDSIRVPSKYPGKRHFKGEKYGQPSGNPLGKNPSDIWNIVIRDWETSLWNIPNVKSNHPEKTIHLCQFPIELVERCVLALTKEDDWVLDPFSGVGSSLLAALKNGRRAFGCEWEKKYVALAHERINSLWEGRLRYRPLGKPIHQPTGKEKVSQTPLEWTQER